jgi:hypothetical protein
MPETRELVTISDSSSGISISGHKGKWYVIASEEFNKEQLYLLEHETYGDEAAGLIVNEKGTVKLDDVFNGFDDYRELLAESEIMEKENKEEHMSKRGSFTKEEYDDRITLANSVSIVDYARKKGLEIIHEDESLATAIDTDTDRDLILYKENNSWRIEKEPGEADEKDITFGNTIRFVARVEKIDWKDAVEKLVTDRGQYRSAVEYNEAYENRIAEQKAASIPVTDKQQTINQQTINQQSINQQTMNQQTVNQQTMNQQSMNQQTMNQQIMNQQTMNQRTMNQQTMNQQTVNQQTINQQTGKQVAPQPSPAQNQNVIEFPNQRAAENAAKITNQRPPMPMNGYRRTFSKEQMAEILAGIKRGINVAPYDNVFLHPEQMKQVRLGLQNGVDPRPYNFPFVPAEYMKEVRLTMQKGLDISLLGINNNGCVFTAEQAREIRKGQENGLSLNDIKFYARPYLDPEAMKEIRIGLQDGFQQMRDLNAGNYSSKDIHTIRITLTINKILQAISSHIQSLYERLIELFNKIVENNRYKDLATNENNLEKADIEKEALHDLKEAVAYVYNAIEDAIEDLPIAGKEIVISEVLQQFMAKADAMEKSTETEPAAIMEQSMEEVIDDQTEYALQQKAFENLKEDYINDFNSVEDNYNIKQVDFSSKVMADNSLTLVQKTEIITETLGSVYGNDAAQTWSTRMQTETEVWKDEQKKFAIKEYEKQQMQKSIDEAMEYEMEH